LAEHPLTDNSLLLEAERQIRALDMNAVLDDTALLIALGAKRDKEAECFITADIKEEIKTFHELLEKGLNVIFVERVLERPVLVVGEVQINHERLRTSTDRPLYDIERAASIPAEIVIEKCKELRILLIWDTILAAIESGGSNSAAVRFDDTMILQELAQSKLRRCHGGWCFHSTRPAV
jgi:hypothetical protein